MPRPITTQQMRILNTVWDFSSEKGYPPTLSDIAKKLGLTPSTVQGHVDRLIRKGSLSRDGEGRRTLRVTAPEFLKTKRNGIPLLGLVQAGSPSLPEENIEYFEMKDLVHLPKEGYLLKVKGDSMIEAGILEGDYVVIDRLKEPRNGSIAVAITPDGDATLKEVHFEANRVRLQPRNSRLQPIYVPNQGQFRGVMVGLIRSL